MKTFCNVYNPMLQLIPFNNISHFYIGFFCLAIFIDYLILNNYNIILG